MNRTRGFTLIELMISVTIMLIAVAVAGAVILAGVNVSRNSTARADQADWSRNALVTIVGSLQRTGFGAPGGVWVKAGATPTRISPIYGVDGATAGPDDLWLITADSNAMRESCVDPNAATTVMTAKTYPLVVGCVGTSFALPAAGAPPLQILVSNMSTAGLFTVTALADAPAKITVSETDVSDSPEKGGFQVGDMVYGAKVLHYYIANDANGVPGLFVATGVTSGAGTAAAPFSDSTDAHLVQANVEDLQVKYGLDTADNNDPSKFTWADGYAANLGTGAPTVRAVRVTVVVRGSARVIENGNAVVLSDDTRPPILDPLFGNHYNSGNQPAADGYRRVIYTRTVELPNLSPASM